LTELIPGLLQSFARCGDPDAAIAAFDDAMARMPAATELFAILKASASLRVLFGDILGAAPRLAAIVTATPHVLDGIIDPTSMGSTFDDHHFARETARLATLGSTEDFLEHSRRIAREQQFLIGVRVLSDVIDPHDAGPAFSSLATHLVSAALAHVRRTFREEHGTIPGARVAIVALGRLGSREMTAASDLDLMVVYDSPDASAMADGRRPLAASQYFTRLTQRLIAALTAPTREGRLYDIDMRLRPWGTQGPLAVPLQAFTRYQAEEAETWERMALCRARPIAGDETLCDAIEDAIAHAIASQPAPTLARDIRDMRKTIAAAKGDKDTDNLKTLKGGLTDIEFIVQYLVLKYAGKLSATSTGDRLAGAAALLDRADAERLQTAHRLYSNVLQMQRLLLPAALTGEGRPASAERLIARGAGLPDASALRDAIRQTAIEVHAIFRRVLSADG
jgi:glutamate-ammonia-ligase adenylyltransferase